MKSNRKEYLRNYQIKHKERIGAIKKKWREENKEILKLKRQEYWQKNKHKLKVKSILGI